MTIHRLIVPLLLAGVVGPLPAQEPERHLAAIRAQAELSEEDQGRVRTFVSQRVDKIVANDAAEAGQATQELRSTYDGSDAFKRVYAAACLERIGPAFKRADLVPAARLLTVVNTLNLADAHPVLLEALHDERVGVRAAGAIGLRTLRQKLALAGREVCQKAWAGLKEAGKQEKSRDTLKTIYAAMDYAELIAAPDVKGNVTTLLELLEARAGQYAAGDVPGVGADDTGLRIAQSLAQAMDDAERKRLMVVVATMMKHAIEQYTSTETKLSAVRDSASREMRQARNAMEQLVLVGEELLTTLLKPQETPEVIDNMKRLNAPGMKVEWQKWVALLQSAVNQDFTLTQLPEPGQGDVEEKDDSE